MALCTWCETEMTTSRSCTVDALHRSGRRIVLPPFGTEPDVPAGVRRCGDCGVARGGLHHPGCDLQQCPACGGQLLSCDCRFDEDGPDDGDDLDDWLNDLEPLGVDGNGCPTERMWLGETEVIVRREDVPESDITTIGGIRCTTALRTVIDLAPEVTADDLGVMLADVLQRGLFTVDEAHRRLAQPDLARHPGAALLRRALPPAG